MNLKLKKKGTAQSIKSRLLFVVAVVMSFSGGLSDLPYRFEFPEDYAIRILCDPCHFSSKTDCCNESYGGME